MNTIDKIKNNVGINVLSLFDGISGGQMSLCRSNIKINKYYASEINEASIGITQYNYPDTIQLGDIRNIPNNMFPKNEIDLLIGGSPCTNFSFAGKRQGASTKEGIEVVSLSQYLELKEKGFEFEGFSYLFWEYVRLLKVIKPKYFLLENVKMPKKWKNVITETLGVEPIMINSALVSAQNRPRLYWTNISGVIQPKDKGIYLKDVLNDDYSKKEILSEKIHSRFKFTPNSKYAIGTTKPEFRTIGQRDYVFGDNNKVGCLTATDYKQPKQVLHRGVLRKVSPIECERFQTIQDDYTKYALINKEVKEVSYTKRFECIGNGWTIEVISHIFNNLKGE